MKPSQAAAAEAAASPASPTHLTLPLHVDCTGLDAGPEVDTFVLLHGFGGSSFTWRYWVHRLGLRGHVVLIDLKGFGAAPKPADGRYGPGELADLVYLLIRQRGFRNLTLVGHSLGGGVALLVAERLSRSDPDRLARLVIVAGAAYRQKLPPFVALARLGWLARALLRIAGARRVVRVVLRSIVYDRNTVTDAQVEGYAEPLASPEARRALVDTALRIVPRNMDQIAAGYREIRAPVLLLWGREDRVVPLSVAHRLESELPSARLVILEACGHLPPEERPDESWAAVERFLDET